jgi:hypothetical protein
MIFPADIVRLIAKHLGGFFFLAPLAVFCLRRAKLAADTDEKGQMAIHGATRPM